MRLYRDNKIVIVLLAALALWLVAFELWLRWVLATPLDEPIALTRGSSVEKRIRVPVRDRYLLELSFEREGVPLEQLKQLVGDAKRKDGKLIPSGVPVPVKWSLARTRTSESIAGSEVEAFGSSGWSAAKAFRNVARVEVEPGSYVFRAEILRDVPELAHVRARIALRLHAHLASAPQIVFAWYGALLNYFVVIPVTAILALFLLYRWVSLLVRGRGESGA